MKREFCTLTFTLSLLSLTTQHARAETLTYDEVVKVLAPLPWVTPNTSKSVDTKSLNFLLEKTAPFSTLSLEDHPSVLADPVEADHQNELFSTNRKIFMRTQYTRTFREAQLAYFSKRKFDTETMQYVQDAPYLKSWGGLPYPPLRTDAQASEKLTLNPFDRTRDAELDSQTGSVWVKNQSLKLYQNADARAAFLNVIQSAKKFVFLNDLSLVCDETTEPIISALETQSRAGVDVRLILNKYFAYLDRACLNRLKESGVEIVQVRSHSSYLVNDQDELLIGSESIARMFFSAHGYDFLDRDQMLLINGPSATDATKDFLSIWEENREDLDRASETILKVLHAKQMQELASKVREVADDKPQGLCRFVAQMPTHGTQEGKIERVFREMISRSKQEIFMSGVRFDSGSPLVSVLQEKAHAGVQVDLLGNNIAGADGELSQYLDEVSERWKNRGGIFKFLSGPLDSIRNWDALRMAKVHAKTFAEIAKNTSIQAWGYFHFLHYKIALFDQSSVWIGSPNVESDNFKNAYESGILCIDPKLVGEISPILRLDLENALPYRH